mgnify:CR=1 FL=1
MKKRTHKRWLATLLAAAMCLSMLPAGAWAAEEETRYVQVTDVSEITSGGEFVLVAAVTGETTEYKALGTTISSKISPIDVTVENDTVTGDLPVWTIAPDSEGNVTLSNGSDCLAYGSSTNFKKEDSYGWNVSAQEGNTFRFVAGTTANAKTVRAIAYGTAANQLRFGPYGTSNASGYVFDLLVFKAVSGGDTPDPTPVKVATPTCAPVNGSIVEPGSTITLSCATENVTFQRSDDGAKWLNLDGETFTLPEEAWEGDYTVYVRAIHATLEDSEVLTLTYKAKLPAQEVTIVQAREAAEGEFIVTGTVIFIDGKNVVIQDETGGINLYCTAAPTGLALGDVVKGVGKRAEYKGLLQLSGASVEKLESGSLPTPADITVAQVGEGYESQLVKIVNAKVTAIDGTTVTLSQGEGDIAATTTIYRCPAKDNLTVGDTITVTAVVSQFNAYQLRVSSADDIEITDDTTPDPGPVDPPEPEKPALADGTYVIYNPAYNKALSTAYTGFYNNSTDVTVTDNVLSGYTNADIWTVAYDAENKTYAISCADGKLSMDTQYASTPLDKVNDQWALEDAGSGLFYVKNTGRSKYIEWYADRSSWSGFGPIDAGKESLFALAFYPATATEEPGPVPSDFYKPEDGDSVVLYYPNGGLVLTGTASGTRLKGAAATLNGDALYTDGSELRLTVAVDEAGEYPFTAPDGKVLNTGATGNSLTLVDAEKATAMSTAKATADSIYAAWQAGESLEALAEDNDKASYTNMDAGSYASSTLMDWLFDSARKEGDSTVLESGSNYYVAVFHSRFREDYNTVAVRHILLTVDDSELDTESETYKADLQALKDATKAEAEDLLAQWKSGEATEDSFAALANEKSEDGGSNTNGGLYSQFPKNYMVQEFNDWCFDSARKSGDTGIVYGESTSYKGYHIMYFVGTDLPYWQVQVTDDLKEEALNEWSETFTQDHTIEQGSGIKYVG